ncbi:gas vesicle protein GvpN [Paenibacillus montanisoli]|uniref:gas vesicle protein GvpN n=1 Tax=Paenibacillus montanisoli TaxID=2081970 RepID=UPI0014040605|nr:gas vesicle protein GvpN [Paenibacillus montanisoli]
MENQFHLANDLVVPPYFGALAARALQYLQAGFPVHLTGPSGVGKSTYALYIASQLNRRVTLIHGNHEMANDDLLGAAIGFSHKKTVDNYIRTVYKKEEEIKKLRVDGPLIEAVKNGHTVIYDEFTRSRPEMNNLFLSILEEKVLPLYGRTEKVSYVPVHPGFSMIFTSNPAEYAGVFQTQDALLDRLITIHLDRYSLEEEALIVSEKAEISQEDAGFVVGLVAAVRESAGNGNYGPGLRAAIMIATIAKRNQIPFHSDDEAFQSLCKDILTYPVSRNLSLSGKHEAQRIIQEAMLRVTNGETAT